MTTHKRIVLYGSSVVIGGVGASLERLRPFEVLHLPSSSGGVSDLEAMAPDVVVFDVESGLAGPAFSLLETRPGLLLLGVSPDGDVVGLWSRRQYRALSSRDLAALIEEVSQEEVMHASTGDRAEGSAERRQGRPADVTPAHNARRGTDART